MSFELGGARYLSDSDRLAKEGAIVRVRLSSPRVAGAMSELNAGYLTESRKARALIDTGASMDGIDLALAKMLKLRSFNTGEVHTASDTIIAPIFQVHLQIPQFRISGNIEMYGLKLSKVGLSYNVLLGRTFLRHFVMNYDGPNGRVDLVPKTQADAITP